MNLASVRAGLLFMVMTLLVLSGCQASTVNGNGQEVHTIVVGSPIAETHPGHEAFKRFEQLVEERSEGRLDIKIYGNGVLGDDRELTESVQRGTIHMTVSSTSPVANFDPSFYIFDLPFLLPDRETAYKILDGDIGQRLLHNLESQNIVGLGYWENGFRQITTSNKPIDSAEDLQGIKIRTMENQLHIAAWREFGANPTPMSFGELFTGLQQGTVDGQENPLALIETNKFYEVQEHLILSNHIYTPFVVMMNKEFHDELPKDLQTIINESMQEAKDYQRDMMIDQDERILQIVTEDGVQVSELPEEEKEKLRELSEPVYESGRKMVENDQLVDEVIAEIDKLQ
ncbi:TRAP transporter substrate-binding protein [Terribacillus saccharophilus]|uniref:TRAP transporter substrate-binding protein n=1 Tax=Terribacillus saccharophilus TaxID=361277 RepID=UPI0039827E3C